MKQFLRRIRWALIKGSVLRKVGEMGIIGYPTIIWIELGGGREIYINEGAEVFLKALEAKADEITQAIVEEFTPDHLKPIEKRQFSITQNIKRKREWDIQEKKEWDAKMSVLDEMEKNMQFA